MSEVVDDIGHLFAHRLAIMLECALLSPEKTIPHSAPSDGLLA